MSEPRASDPVRGLYAVLPPDGGIRTEDGTELAGRIQASRQVAAGQVI
ncbi:MAG: hypothetical protein ABI645_05305 [Pseudomonadota bacterium]